MSKKMKDSGIENVGLIPDNWQTVKFNRLIKHIKTGLNPRQHFKLGHGENYYVTIRNFKDNTLYLDDKCDRIDDEALKKINARSDLQVGDILFASISDEGHIYQIKSLPYNWNINESVFVIRPDEKFVLPDFLAYVLPKNYFFELLKSDSTGSTFQSIKHNSLKNSRIVLPPINDQKLIIEVLNTKTNRIKNLIIESKQSIAELKKYKQSIITEAVTKGIDPNVEMKDSGIKWVGDIPEHWETRKISNYFSQVKNKNDQLQEENLLSLSYGAIIRRNINSTDGLLPANFKNYNIVDFGDIVLRMTDLQNDKVSLRTGFVTEKGIITSAYITIRTNHEDEILPKFVQLYLHSFDIYKGFYGMGSGVRQNVTYNDIKKIQLLVPPLDEQHQIVSYIDEQTFRIDMLIEDKTKFIDELESYKKSLIYEYVTGKKEV